MCLLGRRRSLHFPRESTADRIPWSLEPGLLEKIQEAQPSGAHGFHPHRDVKLVYDRGKQFFHLIFAFVALIRIY